MSVPTSRCWPKVLDSCTCRLAYGRSYAGAPEAGSKIFADLGALVARIESLEPPERCQRDHLNRAQAQ